jgi:cytidylate kinase
MRRCINAKLYFNFVLTMKKIVIAVDGFSSCGKSTLAEQMADQLNYIFVDSGAMYRAITLFFLRKSIDLNKKDEVKEELKNIKLEFVNNDSFRKSNLLLNGENVEGLIRDMIVSDKVSEVAAIKEVREFAVTQQRKMGEKKGLVMDGRDIGTTVFPNAELKIFVTADPEIRADRRFKELLEINPSITLEEIRKNLQMRDYIDSHREVSPLRIAEDAIILDNSHLSREDQLTQALKWVEEKTI